MMPDQPTTSAADVTDKSKKYDRQLRLWGERGQAALESARVCLVNATATGTEILKNLILPGIGCFTIVDGKKVTGEDIGNNFFLDKNSLGKSRAQVATELLLELNEDVSGDFVEESVDQLLQHNASFFTSFAIVIATSLNDSSLTRLSSLLWANEIPLIVVSSYGLIGYLRVVTHDHTVVESHPDSAHEDLRLDWPFPGLVAYCDSLSLETMSKKEHSHTPWLVLIYKYLQEWKEKHNGEVPKNYREKNEFKEYIRQGIRRNEEGVPEDEENFDEAITHVNSALVPTKIPSEVVQIFNDNSCKELDSETKSFWLLARAVKEFVENEGQGNLPLRGSIPDMTADSERYIQLQNVYREQAAQDIAAVTQHLHNILQGLGREDLLNVENRSQSSPPSKPRDCISESDIKLFCKNSAFLRLVRCSSIEQEYNPSTAKTADIGMALEDEDSDTIHYVMLRAVSKFHSEYNRYPGSDHHTLEADVPKLKACVAKLIQEWGLSSVVKDDFIQEYCRYGAAELHSVASYMGGSAAQEAIKLITNQFIPVNNTYIYNAMKHTSTTLKL